jgi:hypothetical protein
MGTIRWKRSTGDYVESHDGEWFITPIYAGRTRPDAYTLRHKDNYSKELGEHQTQKDAKEWAECLKEKRAKTVDKA